MGAAERGPIRVSLVTGTHRDTLASSLADGHERLAVADADPATAIEVAVEGTADCVVCGQALGETTGVDLLASIREDRPSFPVFLYPTPTAAGPGTASSAVTAGVTEYLPGGADGVSPAQLAARIVETVSEQRRGRDWIENEEQYLTMLDTVGDLVYTLDPDGRFTFINETGADLAGYDRSEMVGEHVSLVLDESAIVAGRDLVRRLWTTENENRATVEMAVTMADGERIPCENHIALLPPRDGEFAGTVGVMRDISERKRREEALEALHDATREMMAAAQADEVATIASRTATNVLHMPLNTVLLYDDEADALRSAASSALTDDLFGTPLEFERDEGIVWSAYENGETQVFTDVSASPDAYNPDTVARSEFILPLGDHGAMIVGSRTVSDFDESHVALAKVLAANLQAALTTTHREQTLRERERQLERQNERLEEFASVVSHDLRNPLSVAQGRLELYAETGNHAHYEKVETAHERMGEIIDEVLALAREGRTVRDLEPVDVSALADDAWSNIVTDSATLDASAAPAVQGDPNRVQQLLENFFRNAVEHGSTTPQQAADADGASSVEPSVAEERPSSNSRSQARGNADAPEDAVEHGSTSPDSQARQDAVEHGSASEQPGSSDAADPGDDGVTIRVGPLDEPDDHGFYVADDGPGIPTEDRDDVFDSGFSTAEDGSGFGLAIVEQIATAHGWEIAIRESWAGGARFEIRGAQLA